MAGPKCHALRTNICLFAVTSCWWEPHLHVCIGFLCSVVSESVQWLVCWQMTFPLNKIQWLDVLNVPEGLWHLSLGQWKTLWYFLPSLNLPFIYVLYGFFWEYRKKNIEMWSFPVKKDSSKKPFTQHTCSFCVMLFTFTCFSKQLWLLPLFEADTAKMEG